MNVFVLEFNVLMMSVDAKIAALNNVISIEKKVYSFYKLYTFFLYYLAIHNDKHYNIKTIFIFYSCFRV